MRILEKITIRNFKSIREQTLNLAPLNVFIGGNGAGKSNFIEAFRFLREIINRNLAGYTAQKGGANTLLYYGRKHSPEMEFFLEFGERDFSHAYKVILGSTDIDDFFVRKEEVWYHDKNEFPERPFNTLVSLSPILKESALENTEHPVTRGILRDLESYRVYHFHDTSDTAAVKGVCDIDDNRFLHPQGENLAAFLYWMREKESSRFSMVRDTIRQVAPFFNDFRLAPLKLNETKIRLEWTENGSDAYFNASSLSDGTLRFICLATLLLQPELPAVVLLDEPELGLHPAAITLLADLLSSAATRTQVIVATQSVTLVNHFAPEHVWTVDREDNQSVFRHLKQADMTEWLDDYSLGELWEKNILGARP